MKPLRNILKWWFWFAALLFALYLLSWPFLVR
jgi:hypothetical protein